MQNVHKSGFKVLGSGVRDQGLKDSDPSEIPFKVYVAELHGALAAGSTLRFDKQVNSNK